MLKIQKILAVAWVCAITVPAAAIAEASQNYITFLDKKQAAIAIVDDALEPYFNQLQPMEISAKTGQPVDIASLDKQRVKCRESYQAAVSSFSEAEQTMIKSLITKIQPVLKRDYPRIGDMPWSFIKISDKIEGGLPHTRGKHIVLSDLFCKHLMMMQEVPPEYKDIAPLPMLELLTHEQVHVFQRINPGCCDSLYSEVWGFEKAESIKGCKWLVKYHLANPDAVDCRWVLPIKKEQKTTYILPLVVFSEGDNMKKMPDDFRMIAVSVTKTNKSFAVQLAADGAPVSQDLIQVQEMRTLFPLSTYVFHPHEASADLFGKMVVFDNFFPKEKIPAEALAELDKNFASLRDWFKKNCKSQPKPTPAT